VLDYILYIYILLFIEHNGDVSHENYDENVSEERRA